MLLATSLVAGAASPAQAAEFITPVRIMPLGASYTVGVGGDDGGYRGPLVASQVVDGYSSDMVGSQRHGPATLYDRDHEGHRGHRIDEIAAIVADRIGTYRPEFVLAIVGTNDVLQQYELETAPDRLSSLLDLIAATRPSTHVIVGSLLPLSDPALDADVRAFNATLPSIVAEKVAQGRKVSFVDLYPLVSVEELVDGVHPNQSAYNKLAAAWHAELVRLREAPPGVSSRKCPCTMWNPDDVPVRAEVTTTTAAEVGVKFRAEKDGYITGVRFYKGEGNTGTHVGSLWRATGGSTGTLLASATFTNETPSGWQEVSFPEPVPVQAHSLYIASYYAPQGRYAADAGYFRDREVVNSPLRMPSQGSINGNGVIRSGSPGLPHEPVPGHDTNYWVDVVFTPSAPATPTAPTSLAATAMSTSQVDLTWSPVAEASEYRLERSTDAVSWAAVATPAAGVTSHSDTGLQAATTYHYRVIAKNAAGESPPSPVATATTHQPSPLAPSSLTASAVSASDVSLTWSDVANESSYRVERSTDGSTWASVATTEADETTYTDTGLLAATTYHYRVFAVNSAGDSPPSSVATVTTLEAAPISPPPAPATLTASAMSSSRIDLAWSDVEGEAGYQVQRNLKGNSWQTVATAGPDVTSYSDTGLTASTTYRYRIIATNSAGDSPPSPIASATTLSDSTPSPPPAPATLGATAVSSSRIDLMWSDVSGETAYRVQRSNDGAAWTTVATTNADVTTHSDDGLLSGTTYFYRVVASNSAGDSPPSPIASATTSDGDPDTAPPSSPSGLKASTPKGRVNLSWTGSTDAGGSGLAGYTVWRSTAGSSGPFTAIGTASSTSFSDAAVTAQTSYWYRITAFDGAGNHSQPSNVVGATAK